VRTRVRLLLASCGLVGVLTYVAWHKQQHPPTVSAPISATASEPREEAQAAAVPQSVLDPLPGWGAAPVPVLQPALVPDEGSAGAATRPPPESQESVNPEASAPLPAQAFTPLSSSEAAPIPLPRPRPRTPPAAAPKRPAAGAPLRIN